MGKLHKTTLILGEGPTEFFYFNSLNDVFKGLTIKPDYPKHTSIKELELKITDAISMGYLPLLFQVHISYVYRSESPSERFESTLRVS